MEKQKKSFLLNSMFRRPRDEHNSSGSTRLVSPLLPLFRYACPGPFCPATSILVCSFVKLQLGSDLNRWVHAWMAKPCGKKYQCLGNVQGKLRALAHTKPSEAVENRHMRAERQNKHRCQWNQYHLRRQYCRYQLISLVGLWIYAAMGQRSELLKIS